MAAVSATTLWIFMAVLADSDGANDAGHHTTFQWGV